MLYRLTAKLGDNIKTVTYEEPDDTEAMYGAIFRILDKASQSRVWALGAIELVNLTTNQTLNTMGGK
jgi:hypothetical protein